MAGASLLALLDDIATILDDVAVMTKVAAKKTAGVLGDDLALNAEQVTGVRADRELPVVWSVFKGSLVLITSATLVPKTPPGLPTITARPDPVRAMALPAKARSSGPLSTTGAVGFFTSTVAKPPWKPSSAGT